MKTFSERSDLFIMGAGLAGICAAVSAAREGVTVRLVEERSILGGKIGSEIRFPLDYENSTNFAYQRETGLLDELLFYLFKNNPEGTYCGQNRALTSWLKSQKRLKVFTEVKPFEIVKSSSGDKISSVNTVSSSPLNGCIIFRSKYFIDCTYSGILSQLSNAPGEVGVDQNEFNKLSASAESSLFRAAASMELKKEVKSTKFNPPEWVKIKWEDNHSSAKIELLKSLARNIEGIHRVEWLGDSRNTSNLESDSLIWATWDYLKNRSPLSDRLKNITVKNFSPIVDSNKNFRSLGEYVLTVNDLEVGEKFYDSVATGRSPLDSTDSLLCSSRSKIALPYPFEIPLRCLISKKIKNLLSAGENCSCTSKVSNSLSHPATSSQMGVAAGICAAICIKKKRLPRTLVKQDNVEQLRKKLIRLNHNCGNTSVEDSDNLIPSSKVVPSTVLNTFGADEISNYSKYSPKCGLIQFPVSGKRIDEIHLFLGADKDTSINFRILEGSANGSTIPGECLESGSFSVQASPGSWMKIIVNVEVRNFGWHFLEFTDNDGVEFYFRQNSPVGLLFHESIRANKSGIINPYSEYYPFTSSDFESANSVFFEVYPHQSVYSASNVQNGKTRPDSLPNLWISDETDFQYPEYLEFHWEKEVEISSIEIVWDSALEFLFPKQPTIDYSINIPSIVSDYKIYYINNVGNWVELLAVSGNKLGFSSHSFQDIRTRAIELEIQKTNGLPRAQVYEVRAYS